jgi:hypothetical protein
LAGTDLHRRIAALPPLVNEDKCLVERGRYVTLDIEIGLGTMPYCLSFERGRIVSLERGPHLLRSFRFAVRGSEEAWQQFWLPLPPPHHHDIFALAKRGLFRIEGDLQPLMANLFYFKDVLAAPRRAAP